MRAPEQVQFLRAYFDGRCYCLDSNYVLAIRRWEELALIGPAQQGTIAAAQARGQEIPIYSIARCLELSTPREASGPVLLISSANGLYGVRCDRVARAVTASESDAQQLPLPARDHFGRIRGALRLNGELAMYLSASRLTARLRDCADDDAPLPEPQLWTTAAPPSDNARLFCLTEPGGDTSERFTFHFRQMIEFCQGLSVFPVPALGRPIAGVVEWRGFLVPVVDPYLLLGRESRPLDFGGGKLAILRGSKSAHLFAIPAHSFSALPLPLTKTKAIPAFGPYSRGAFRYESGSLIVPDLDCLAA